MGADFFSLSSKMRTTFSSKGLLPRVALVFFTGLSHYGSTMGHWNLPIHSLNINGTIHEYSSVQLGHLDSNLDIQIPKRFWEISILRGS